MPTYDDYVRDYWAPDREQVLADMQKSQPNWQTHTGQPADGQQGSWFDQNGPQGGSNQVWDEVTFAQRFGRPSTPDELIRLEEQLRAAGITVMRNASGVAGKIRLPNGQIVDVINSAGIGGRGFQWLTGDGGSGGGGGIGSGELLFRPPSLRDFQGSPMYRAGLEDRMFALQNSAAAKGTLLNGRVLQAMARDAQDYGVNQYSNWADLRLRGNQANAGNLRDLANLGR